MKSLIHPKITILLATFNRAHLILETLESIKNQTYTYFECLITDDNSTDETEVVINAFIESDSRFFYFKKTEAYPQGLSATRNFGLDLAQKRNAEFIQFFDDDDIMHPQKLELQIEPFIEEPKLDITICMYRKFWDVTQIQFNLKKAFDPSYSIKTDNLLRSFYLNQIHLNSLGPIWKFEVLKKYRFDTLLFYAEEREFYLRIFLKESLKYQLIEQILCWYRKHDQAITSNLYSDPNLKGESERLFQKKFLKLVLKQSSPPFFILKSYTKIAVRRNNTFFIDLLSQYFSQVKNIFKPKYFALWMYIKMSKVLHLVNLINF
ncbi:glycosyltransferase family 2 protein [Leeuwenhoekiella sp. LLG6367-2.1]|uniref:glycosyltransferase family 2 protein n=1 Tax=Leeuwenhoekiella sp. LLG6367-2.1 TaxID=3160833 RepID=UPI00386C89BF